MKIKELEGIIEGILFTMGESVDLKRIAAAVDHDEDTVRKIIYRMMDQCRERSRGVQIIELNGAFQMCTKTENYEYLIRLAKQPRKAALTEVMLETLSIIAYKQPITRIEVEKIRGVKSDHALNKLIEYELVCELGRLDAPGRPLLFGTTEEFLRRFGIGSLSELPVAKPEQMADFQAEAEDEAQLKLEV